MFIGSVALFSVKIFASLWTVAVWVDEKLVEAMYPKAEFGIASLGVGAQATFANGFKETVLSTLVLMLFMGLPMSWVSMLSRVSIRISNALGLMLTAGNKTAKASAAYGFNRAGQVAGTVLSAPISGGRAMAARALPKAWDALTKK